MELYTKFKNDKIDKDFIPLKPKAILNSLLNWKSFNKIKFKKESPNNFKFMIIKQKEYAKSEEKRLK